MDPVHFIQRGYIVEPALNGGYVVRECPEFTRPTSGLFVAFTTYREMLAWLEQAHVALEGPTKDLAVC